MLNFLTKKTPVTSQLDAQFVDSDDVSCRFLLEALLRRLVEIHGSHRAAVVVQQYADACAVHDLRPVEFWKNEAN